MVGGEHILPGCDGSGAYVWKHDRDAASGVGVFP